MSFRSWWVILSGGDCIRGVVLPISRPFNSWTPSLQLHALTVSVLGVIGCVTARPDRTQMTVRVFVS